MTTRLSLLALLCLAASLPIRPALAAPDWIADPANSKWVVLGGDRGAAEERGLFLQPGGGEGEMVKEERAGVACTRSVAGAKSGLF